MKCVIKHTLVVLVWIIPSLVANAQWKVDSSIDVAYVKSGDFKMSVLCNSIAGTYIVIEVNRRISLMQDSRSEYFVGLAWNGNDMDYDFPIANVRQFAASDPEPKLLVIMSSIDTGALSVRLPSLIAKLKVYSSVKVVVTDSSAKLHFATFSLRGSTNAINKIQESCS